MLRIAKLAGLAGIGAGLSMLLMGPAAQEASAGVSPETQYIPNTLSFLMHGFLVMWMAAGSQCWRPASCASGIIAIGAFIFCGSLIVWSVFKGTIGIRITEEDEQTGIDQVELGMEAYPEFGPSLAH